FVKFCPLQLLITSDKYLELVFKSLASEFMVIFEFKYARLSSNTFSFCKSSCVFLSERLVLLVLLLLLYTANSFCLFSFSNCFISGITICVVLSSENNLCWVKNSYFWRNVFCFFL